jgi:AAA ATPase domain
METTGEAALVTVFGYPGIGKSALVDALRKPIVAKHGYFSAGKFDQYRRDIRDRHASVSRTGAATARRKRGARWSTPPTLPTSKIPAGHSPEMAIGRSATRRFTKATTRFPKASARWHMSTPWRA